MKKHLLAIFLISTTVITGCVGGRNITKPQLDLWEAIKSNNSVAVELASQDLVMLNSLMPLSVPNQGLVSETPLVWAISHNANLSVIEQLVKSGANVNAVYENKYGVSSPLAAAINTNNLQVIEYLVKSGAMHSYDGGLIYEKAKLTGLLHAAGFGTTDSLQILIDQGADVNYLQINSNGSWYPLTIAAQQRKNANALLLIKNGADVSVSAGVDSDTPLHYAVAFENIELIHILLEHGADISKKNKKGLNPVEFAIRFNKKDSLAAIANYAEKSTPKPNTKKRSPPDSLQEVTLSSTGTGFFINNDRLFVTNAHVTNDCQKIEIRNKKYKSSAEVISEDTANDLSLLLAKSQNSSHATLRGGRSIRAGDEVIALGYPLSSTLGDTLRATTGSVSALTGLDNTSSYMQISAPVQPGNSGGPLLDQSGNLIGVVSGRLYDKAFYSKSGVVPQNVNFAIKSQTLQMFLDTNSIDYDVKASTSELTNADIVENSEGYTAQVLCFN
jgi:S1-C subfamily serine protease